MNMELKHRYLHVTGCQSWTWCHPPLPGPSHESHQRHICHTVTRPPTLPSTQAAKYYVMQGTDLSAEMMEPL